MRSGRARATARTAAVLALPGLALAGCGGGPSPDARPANAAGGWGHRGSSATASFDPLPIGTGWGPSAEVITRARALVGRMTLRERAGQVIVATYAGTGAPTALVNRLHLGGVVAFSENVRSAGQVAAANRALQKGVDRPYPVLVGVDQEGGRVVRVRAGATSFPAFMSSGAAGDPGLTKAASAASGGELRAMGFTVDFAPDADVTVGPSDPAIGSRSAGSTPSRVADQVLAATQGYASAGLVPVLKHFPGHGSVTTDSHVGLPVQRRSVAELTAKDLVPFRAAVAHGASAVMVGHLDVRALDPRMPSSLSHAVVTGLLRDKLGFDGVAFTDSLEMGAITQRFGGVAASVRALKAGEDVLLMPPDPRAARDGIVRAVKGGRLDQARLDQAATRMVAMMLHQRDQKQRPRRPGSSGAVSQRLSSAALTSVAGRCSGRVVGRLVRVSGPSSAVARFRSAAAAEGLSVLRATPPKGKKARKQWKAQRARSTSVRLVGYPNASVRGDVVVATDTPYVLGRSSARLAKVATFGDTPEAMHSLVAFLVGAGSAPGSLPVPVPGLSRTGC